MATTAEIPLHVRDWLGKGLFEHVPSSVIVIDRQFNIVTANSSFIRVFGDAEGKYCFQAYKKRESPCDECLTAKTFEDGEVRITDTQGIDKNGHTAHYVVHIVPIRDELGEISHVIEMSYDITESQILQRQYNLLFERVPCYVAVIDRNFRVVRANELLRNTFGDRVGEQCFRVLKQSDERCVDCPAMKTFADGGSYTSRQVGIDKQGDITRYVVSTAPLSRSGKECEHVIEMAVDVTESEELSARLLREAHFRQKLTASAIDGLVAGDATGTINIFNSAAAEMFKLDAVDVLGKKQLSDLLPEEFLRATDEGKTSLNIPDTTVMDAEGNVLPVRLSGTVLREGDRVLGSAAFLQDLREYKKLEQEKLENERLAAVGSTVAQLAHGVKNILTALQGGMYVIQSGIKKGSTERTNKGWEMLERNIQRITVLVRGFLSFSRGHVPKAVLVQPAKIADEVVEFYKAAAKERGVDLQCECSDNIAPASLDLEDIRTCLENLVSNAIDACQSSNRDERIVKLRATDNDGTLVFEVSDNGVGMDCEIKNKVFTTFFTTKGLGGTGLGLMVTRKIVQQHGGTIAMESVKEEGSKFRIELPRDRLPQPSNEEIVASNHSPDGD
jgi:PAS domain S-box-containing protein